MKMLNMKLPSEEHFNFKDCIIGGDECFLITPKQISVEWTPDNECFRSCIVRKSDNHIISIGFKKFTNIFETPHFQPWNPDWKFEAYHKIDGSLLCCSKYKGEIIARTRGIIDARSLPNGHEIDLLIAKYPQIFNNPYIDSENWTLHCEWTTPNNIICIREHDEPTLTLLGMIRHDFLSYMPQKNLDMIGTNWNINRPKKYEYDSISECIADVELWKDREGVVIYSSDDGIWNNQTLKKIKASHYLAIHRLASGVKNINQVLEVFMTTERYTKYEDFYKFIETSMDFEIAERIKDDMLKIVNAFNKTLKQMDKVRKFVNNIRGESFTRKDQAEEIIMNFKDWQKSAAFCVLDNKIIDDKFWRAGIEKNIEL